MPACEKALPIALPTLPCPLLRLLCCRMAVAEWSKLSEEEKAACQAKYAPIVAGMAEGEHGTEDEEHGEGEEEEAGGHHGGGGGGHGFVDSLTADSPKKKKGKGHHHH